MRDRRRISLTPLFSLLLVEGFTGRQADLHAIVGLVGAFRFFVLFFILWVFCFFWFWLGGLIAVKGRKVVTFMTQ